MKRHLLRIALVAVIAIGIVFAFLYRDQFSAAALEQWVGGFGPAGPAVFMLVYAVGTVFFLPGSVLTLAAGALFGPAWGTFYSLTGATLGATLAFLVARYLAAEWAERHSDGRLGQVKKGVEQEGWRFVAFVRLVPLFPFNALNYALGLTRIPLGHYVIASYITMLPGAVAFTYLGYVGREAVAGGQGMIQKGMLALALLAFAGFLPRLVRRVHGGAGEQGGKLNTRELKERLARKDDIVVLDVRPAADYAGPPGHIPGSINIPLDQLPLRLAELEPRRERPLAVICRTNRMSGKAVALLRDNGFRQTLLVEDGMVGWQQQNGSGAAPAIANDSCSTTVVPAGPSAGTRKIVTLIIHSAPYRGDNKAWHALRFAGAALVEDMKVRIHLLDEGAQMARRGHEAPEGAVNLEHLMAELMECGLEVRACGLALADMKLDTGDLILGIKKGSMKSLAQWVKESDLLLAF